MLKESTLPLLIVGAQQYCPPPSNQSGFVERFYLEKEACRTRKGSKWNDKSSAFISTSYHYGVSLRDHLSASNLIHSFIRRYLQVAFNVVMISAVLYCVAQFFLTIQRDVQIKVNEELSTIMTEISQCAKQYVENRCSPELRVPAMEKACTSWENCMKRDPSVVGRAKLSAETFAEIINSFIEPISYKTMIFMLTALFGTIFLSNYAFSIARNRVSAGYVNNFGPNPVAFRDQSIFPGLGMSRSAFSTPGGKAGSLLALQ